jgi:hypothetical protein
MKKFRSILSLTVLLVLAVSFTQGAPANVKAQAKDKFVYLPTVYFNYNPLANSQIANAPYIDAVNVTDSQMAWMGVFWFGAVRSDTNYADVRIAYNDNALWVRLQVFDRWLWYNPSSNGTSLENWDAATLLLDLDGTTVKAKPDSNSYRFVSQLSWWETAANYKSAYQGNGSGWISASLPFEATTTWRGNAPNDTTGDRGWTDTFVIPYSSLGLTGKPADGTLWHMAVLLHDRDSGSSGPLADQSWPGFASRNSLSSWGKLRFGLPTFTPPAVSNVQTTMIRAGLNGNVVPDASVGGGTVCGGDLDFFNQWGNMNYAGEDYFNIQNQGDVADWPCFSKYYVTFPLSSIPNGKVIRSARLVLHEFGGSLPSQAYDSYIQVLQVGQTWDERTITWNNAPETLENIARSWVKVYNKDLVWPGDPYSWDVSRAVVQAYAAKMPLNLALYSADPGYHSGKYFVSSDAGDWNAEGRPTLIIEWGNP